MMLQVNHLFKSYQTGKVTYPVLKDVCFEVNKGEFVGIMGASGSGKTTMLNCISCFLPFDKGEIRLKGTQLSQLDEGQIAKVRNEQLGVVFQDFMLLDGLTVFENVCVPKVIKNEPYKPMEKKARELLKMFGIEHIADKFPAEISGGQKQRVAVARSLMNDPLLILADEPTGNLDSRSSEAVIQAFIEAKEQLGATTLMVTHDTFSASYCDRVITDEPTGNLDSRSSEAVIQAFIEAKEQLGATTLMVTHDTFSASYCDRVIMMKDGSVHSELVNHGDRKAFLEDLLNVLRELNGGDDHDVA